jgi:polyisoprenoid-binding protein YceI
MKKNTFAILSLSVASVALMAFGNPKHVDVYKVDASKSSVNWTGEKVTGKHMGTINIKSGELHNNHGRFSGKFTIDMNTIVCTDLSGDGKTKLEGHLKNDDFFGVDKFPTSTFEITGIAPLAGVKAGEPNFNISGKLTIKGITHDLTFPALIRFDGPVMTANADVKVDRTKYDIRYGSKSFFSDIGDKAIYDEFLMNFNIVATL